MCLGEEYAKMLLLLFGAGVLQRFTLLPPDGGLLDDEGEMGITFTPKKHKIKILSRNRIVIPKVVVEEDVSGDLIPSTCSN